MKREFTFLIAIALAICSLFMPTEAKSKMDNLSNSENAKLLIVGSPSIGLQTVLEIAARHSSIEIVAVKSDGDGIVNFVAGLPPIINNREVIPIATVERIEPNIHLKTETRKSVNNLIQNEFFDVPPNDFGYNGESFANRTRAEPRKF